MRACANLAVVVQAGPKICASARSALHFARYRQLLAGTKDNPTDPDVTSQLSLIGALEAGRRQRGIAGLAPHVSISSAQGEARSDVDEQIDFLLAVTRRQRRGQQRTGLSQGNQHL